MIEQQMKSIESLRLQGKFKQALIELDILIESRQFSKKEYLTLLFLKCDAYNALGNYDKAKSLSAELLKESQNQKNKLKEVDARLAELFAEYRLHRIDRALELADLTEELTNNSHIKGMKERKALLQVNRVYIHTANSEVDRALISAQESLSLSKEIKDESHLARAYYALGWAYSHKGDADRTIEFYKKSLNLREKIENQLCIAQTLFSLGYQYRIKGELDTALGYFKRSLRIRESIGNQQDISWILLNLGDVYTGKRDFNKAQKYYEESLEIFEKIGYILGTIYSFMRLSTIYEENKNPHLGKTALEKALKIAQRQKSVESEVYVLYYLIRIMTRYNIESDVINDYLKRLQTINFQYENEFYNQIYRLAKALVLKTSDSTDKKRQAQRIFREITEEKMYNYFFTIDAMMNFSEMLARDLEKYIGKHVLVSKLNELTDKFSPISNIQGSYSSFAESYLRQSQLALAEVDIPKARQLLKRAQSFYQLLTLYNKGPTPFRILYALFIKERSLNELSRLLNITKGGLNRPLKLLRDLELVKVARTEQVRSATILKKYYSLGEKALESVQPFTMNLLKSLNLIEDQFQDFTDSLMSNRMMIKLIQDSTNLIDMYQNFHEQILMRPLNPSESDKFDLTRVKNLLSGDEEIRIVQHFLSEKQYKIYLELWSKFLQEVQENVFKQVTEDEQSFESQKPERSKYVAHIMLPLKELLIVESIKELREKEKRKSRR
ncbi:MAG: tetratricopeptide repeat protein [Promethearchaeota archaeon]